MSGGGHDSGDGGGPSAPGKDLFTNHHFSAFVAAQVMITAVPRFTMARIPCLGGSHGPFAPNYPVDVPLWLALHLRQTDTCTITTPAYLQPAYLDELMQREHASDTSFEPLPFYFFEVAKLLLDHAHEDISDAPGVVRRVSDLRAMRRQKLLRSMAVLEGEGTPLFIPGIKLSNIVSQELQFLRTSFATVLGQAASMERRRQQRVGLPAVAALPTPSSASRSARGTESGRPSHATPATTMTATATSALGSQTTVTHSVAGTYSIAGDSSEHAMGGGGMSPGGGGGEGMPPPSLTPGTVTTTTAESEATAPLVQPPVKKRRTLRQT